MPNDKVKSLLENIWGKREMGLDISADIMRDVSPEDIEFLRNYRYPFLQIINTTAEFSGEVNPKFISVSVNDWVIFDYGDAMSSAAPHDSDKDSGDSGDGGGSGTIIKQQYDTVTAMMETVKQKGWTAIEIIDGTPLMQFYAWLIAQELGIEIEGYYPTAEQRRHYDFVKNKARNEQEGKAKKLQG